MSDLTKLSASKLEALYEKRQAACSANCRALIDAGRGMERHSDTTAKAKTDADPLSLEYVRLNDARWDVLAEMNERKRYHGSLKPIKRAS